jgi:cbb3-type cytochrome oxidase subunit 3
MNVRLAVGSALIIGTAVFYIAYWFSMFQTQNKKAYMYMNEVASKYYLFGLGALLSLNYFQAGIFQTVMIFIVMFSFFGVILSALVTEAINDKVRSLMYIMFYTTLFAWYLGIVIDFYVVTSSL